MATYKNITVKKRGGGTRKQRVQVLASGKYKFVKNIGKSKSKAKGKAKKAKTTKRRSMAKKKKNSRRRKFTLPMAVITPFVWKSYSAIQNAAGGNYDQAVRDLMWHFAAIDSSGNFNPDALKTWIPVIMGLLVHKFVGGAPLNLNRALGNAGVPIIRI